MFIKKENNVATKPTDSTKDDYKFVEWQLNGKTYDFNTKVTSDITLKAKWEKKSNTSSDNNTNTESNKTNSTNSNTTGDSSSNNNNTPKETSTNEQNNEILKSQLKAKGLQWDFNTEEEAYDKLYLWMENDLVMVFTFMINLVL